MSKNYQQLFREIVDILRRDYAGKDRMGERFFPRYYTQAIGQAWNDGRLDDRLFLQYVSQMLACIGDRNLRLDLCSTGDYTPQSPGFFTRRYGDALYVTAVTSEPEIQVGDRILSINGGSPAKQKALIQKDFFRGSVPEREDWNGLLKMADFVDVLRPDGTEKRLPLRAYPLSAPALTALCTQPEKGVVYLRPAPFEDGTDMAGYLEHLTASLSGAKALILDLRNGRGHAEDEILPLLPWLCREETPLSLLLDGSLMVNHTRLNCILKAAGLPDSPEAQAYIQELTVKADTGFQEEFFPAEELVCSMAPETVVILTDTWCRDSAETLALAARWAGAYLMGRPTLGTIDTCAPVSYAMDERFVLTWPTALSLESYQGQGYQGCGIKPNEYIPWTPEECFQDILLERALAYIHKEQNQNS